MIPRRRSSGRIQERDGGVLVMTTCSAWFPFEDCVRRHGYQGPKFAKRLAKVLHDPN